MRDLERLRERSEDTAGRKFGLFALAGTLSVAAIISLGVMSGGAREIEPEKPDPLAQLALTGANPKDPKASEPASKDQSSLELGARLSFPATLAGEESPLETMVRAAGSELAKLPRRARPSESPASTLASEQTDRLARAARHDPLMAQAMPERTAVVAPAGSEGAFTLQVVSFQTREAADKFVTALRARG
ncbi:MAG TPA: hypothetical protein VI299_21425, partial [Polyangiales bacterium]